MTNMKHLRLYEEFNSELPKVLYHGSPYKIDTFSNKIKDESHKTGGDEYGYGTYLTPIKELAKHYAKKGGFLYSVNIIDGLCFLKDSEKPNTEIINKSKEMFKSLVLLDHKNEPMANEFKQYLLDGIIKDSENGRMFYIKILRVFSSLNDKLLSEKMDEFGINGLIGNDKKEIVIFNVSNIKIINIEKV